MMTPNCLQMDKMHPIVFGRLYDRQTQHALVDSRGEPGQPCATMAATMVRVQH